MIFEFAGYHFFLCLWQERRLPREGWQNKAVVITGATFWQNKCIDLSIYHWKHFVFCFFVKNKINKCFEF